MRVPSGGNLNKPALGTWAWAVYQQPNNPKEMDDRIKAFLRPKNGKASDIIDKPKDVIELVDGGKITQSRFFGGYFWSGNMLIGVNDCQALKFEVKTFRSRDFLLLGRGGFNVTPESDDDVVIPKGLALRLSCLCEAVAAF